MGSGNCANPSTACKGYSFVAVEEHSLRPAKRQNCFPQQLKLSQAPSGFIQINQQHPSLGPFGHFLEDWSPFFQSLC